MWSLSRLSLVFCIMFFLWFRTFYYIVTFLIIIEISNMTQVFASYASNVGGIDTSSWVGVFLGLLMIKATLFFFLLLKVFFRGLAFFRW